MKRIITVVALGLALSGCGIFKGDSKKPKTPVLGERLPVLNYEEDVRVDPALADVTVSLPSQVENSSWTQPGGDASKTMGHLALNGTLQRAWTVSIGQGGKGGTHLLAGPVIAGGKVFTIDNSATVRAFDATSGRAVWQSVADNAAKKKEKLRFGGGVSFSDGKLFAGTGTGAVTAFDAATGKKLWQVTPGGPLRGAPAVADGRLFVISQDNQIYALDANDGKSLWEISGTIETAAILGTASPAVAEGTAVVGLSSGELYALRVENGRNVWQDALARTGISVAVSDLADIDASPVIDRGRVFAVGHGGRMAALELATGQRVWEINIAGISTPWVAGEWVYVVTSDARLLCISRGTGKLRWATQLAGFRNVKKKDKPIRWSGPVLAGDRLLLTASTGKLTAVSPYDGKIISETKLGGDAYLPASVASKTLYVLTDDGRLSAWR